MGAAETGDIVLTIQPAAKGAAGMESNGIGICDWPQWSQLSNDQQQYELHRNLKMLNAQMRGIQRTIRVYAGVGGIVGGMIAVFTIYGMKSIM
jgi:hypothetical protein